MSMRKTSLQTTIGKRFGNLEVIKYHHSDERKLTYWLCRCDCGRVLVLRGELLAKGYIRSCGCRVTEEIETIPVKEGQMVSFDPFEHMECSGSLMIHSTATGRVKKVYDGHRWFSVEYGNRQRISFHFCDVGKTVSVCG